MRFKLRILWYLVQFKWNHVWYASRLNQLQSKRWKKLSSRLGDNLFYKKYFEQNKKLSDFPLMNKALFMANFDALNTKGITLKEAFQVAKEAEASRDFSPMIGKITVGLSTGTTGNRGVFLVSEEERAKWVAAILDRVIGFSFKKRKVAFFLRANSNLYQSTQSSLLAFHFFDLLLSFEQIHLPALNKLQPHILIAQPSMLSLLAKAKENGELHIQPQKIISVAEVLSIEDATYFSKVFQQTIHQVYQCSEGFLGCTCKEGNLHLNEDFLHIEKKYLDETHTRFHPIITDLMRTTQPVIRYELNDILVEKNDCLCGSSFTCLEKIEGRSDDILYFDNLKERVRIFPDYFSRAIVMSDESIKDYALVQTENTLLELYIKSDSPQAFRHAELSLKNLLQKFGVSGIEIRLLKESPHVLGSKKRRIIHAHK